MWRLLLKNAHSSNPLQLATHLFILGALVLGLTSCQKPADDTADLDSSVAETPSGELGDHSDHIEDDWELLPDPGIETFACSPATKAQIATLNSGTQKLNQFLAACYKATDSSPWCDQLVRPNPQSRSIFSCTYGASQAHYMIHPDESTWPNAFKAVQLVKELEQKNIKVCLIYNWWRPEPYNANVGGASGRHPFGTAVDVRFCSMSEMEKGFKQLCAWRKAGRLRAVGYYGSTGLHFGIADKVANTWGKACP
jgi:hypothetical protein